jgi:two-component system CheB/CheR fusion protein
MDENKFTPSLPEKFSNAHTRKNNQRKKDPPFPVVLIIIPAGDYAGLSRLIHHLPSSLGMSYVIAEYWPLDHVGALPGEGELLRLLEGKNSMKIQAARQGTVLIKDQVYLLSPQMGIGAVDDKLVVFSRSIRRKEQDALDLLLADLAYACSRQAIVVLQTGIAMDLTAGLRVIRAEGGFTFIQRDSSQFMDLSHPGEITGCIDFILPSAAIASRLKWLKDYFGSPPFGSGPAENDQVHLGRLYLLLLKNEGVDFSRYKQAHVLDRIRRRMAVYGVTGLEEYLSFLEDNMGELRQLYRDLLNSISGIFLEPETTRVLASEVLPRLLKNRTPSAGLRIWIPQCSGGEEACSIAICVSEYLKKHDLELPVQVFATDMNKGGIERARLGHYEESALSHVSPRRLKRYFTKLEEGYQLSASVREMCVFATHNLLKDPPFSNVDIIVCRNVLTGLDADHQDSIFRSFHYALNPEGFLLMESHPDVLLKAELFEVLGTEPGIYRRKEAPAAFLFPSFFSREQDGEKEAAGLLLGSYTPAAVLVNDSLEIVRFYGNSSPYLRPSFGKSSLNLLQLLDDSLFFDVNSLFERLKREGKAVRSEVVSLYKKEALPEIIIELVPLRTVSCSLLIFRETSYAAGDNASAHTVPDGKDRKLHALEKQLREARLQLAAGNQEAARLQEELQTTREELMSANEELHSLNEALSDSKLDLESHNHELSVVNTDLSTRNKELESSVEYAHAIVAAIRQPLVILRGDLRIRTANEAFYSYFGLDPIEVHGHYFYSVGNGLFDLEDLRGQLVDMLARKVESLDVEIKHSFPKLGERILSLHASRMQEFPRRRPGILLVMEDITDRKMAERFKDEFIGIASHELKTPATSIQAYTQILYNEFLESNDQRSAQLVSRLNSQVTKLAHLAKDLLDITRITQGQISLKKNYFDVNALIREIVEDMQLTTQIPIRVGELPPAPELWGDRDRVGQVLVNLLSNAAKYAAGAPGIDLFTVIRQDALHISVRDYGIGMSSETMQKIFDRFYRSDDPASLRHPGLGLGLYIASEIVKRHGGTIAVRSELGKGSVFTAVLPWGKPE